MDNQPVVKASAPGSLMLLGEHAVLHGRRALVCAIDRRMTVELFQCLEKKVRIFSDLGNYESPLNQLEDHPDFRFVLDAVKQYTPEQGIELKISSDFSSDIGFGSSAAVTVATHAVLAGDMKNKMELFKRSLATVHRVQGRGSGADVAASVFGGVVAYRADPLEISPMCEEFPLTAVYSGSKMKTVDVIKIVEGRRKSDPEKYDRTFDAMDASVGRVIVDFKNLAEQLTLNQQLMASMGLCNDSLAEIISSFQTLEIPAKISGSGLGDCAIGLGNVSSFAKATADRPPFGKYKSYALRVTTQGACLD